MTERLRFTRASSRLRCWIATLTEITQKSIRRDAINSVAVLLGP